MEYLFAVNGQFEESFHTQSEELYDLLLELDGRIQLPRTWTLVDWLRARPKASSEILERRKKRQTVLGLLCLLLALFALGPAILIPKELLPVLLMGAACLGTGVASLWRRHRIMLAIPLILSGIIYGIAGLGGGEEFRPLLILGVGLITVAVAAIVPERKKRNRTVMRNVSALFERRSTIKEQNTIQVCFSQQGIQVFQQQEQSEIVPYDKVSGILETKDLLVIVLADQGFLLAKSELIHGAFTDFKADLFTRVLWISKGEQNGYGKA